MLRTILPYIELLKIIYGDNPFIGVAGTEQDAKFLNDFSKSLASNNVSFSPFGNATIIVDGIGKFLAKRTKEELNVMFFDRFREFLNTHPEIAQVFPSTTTLLNNILNYEYPNVLSTLRAAFDSDLKSMLHNLASIADINPSACNKCSENKKNTCKSRLAIIKSFFTTDKGRALVAGLLIADGVVSKENPADILSSIVDNNTIQTIDADLYNSLKLLRVFSESLRSDEPGKIWISTSQFETLVGDSTTLNIFLGLVYQKVRNENIIIGNQDIATTYITPANISGLRSYLDGIVKAGKKLEENFNRLKDSNDTTTNEIMLSSGQFVAAFKSFFNTAIQYNTISSSIPRPGNNTKLIFTYIDTSFGIVQKILVKEYYGALLSCVILVENMFQTKNDFNSKGKLNADDEKAIDTALAKKQFLRTFLRYGNFAANVVAAKNSDDVEKAIEDVALPSGSSLIKRTTNFNIAVQAYTGFVSGDIKEQKGFWNFVSVYAPVGLSFNIGLRSFFRPRFAVTQNPEDKRTWGSFTVFASIIDVGAVVAYRFYHAEDKLSDSVNVAWSNVFAPGLNLVYGIPKCPLSIGFGAQYQASLRKFDASTATVIVRSGLRYNFFLALDLPLLNLYTSRK